MLDWCKLFGSDDEEHQPTHWKSALNDHDEFRRGLRAAVGLTQGEWNAYWKEMKRYRDNAVAHHSTERRKIDVFPKHELALKFAYFYYECVRELLLKEFPFWEPEDFEGLCGCLR